MAFKVRDLSLALGGRVSEKKRKAALSSATTTAYTGGTSIPPPLVAQSDTEAPAIPEVVKLDETPEPQERVKKRKLVKNVEKEAAQAKRVEFIVSHSVSVETNLKGKGKVDEPMSEKFVAWLKVAGRSVAIQDSILNCADVVVGALQAIVLPEDVKELSEIVDGDLLSGAFHSHWWERSRT